ncbi:zinc finger transcription factor ace1 [Apiospora hydei]|uniref:Zinc finger transcription factor ace1 n=1 Tax=Apiospora hydei TaxID=1337664 RepID=A0ABR1V478_9PEZI
MEVVGVVLGVIPLIIEGIKFYRTLADVSTRKSFLRKLLVLTDALQTEHTILRNTYENILRDIEATEGQSVGLEAWKDGGTLQKKVEERLGSSADSFRRTAQNIESVIKEMMTSLGIDASGKVDTSYASGIKMLWNQSEYDEMIARLNRSNLQLAELSRQTAELGLKRRRGDRGSLVRLARDLLKNVYNALNNSLSCSCPEPHGVNLQLESYPPSLLKHGDEERATEGIIVHAVLSFDPHGRSDQNTSWGWEEIEIQKTKLKSSPSEPPATVQLTKPRRLRKKEDTKRYATELLAGMAQLGASVGKPSCDMVVLDLCETLGSSKSQQSGDAYGYMMDRSAPNECRLKISSVYQSHTKYWTLMSLKDILLSGNWPTPRLQFRHKVNLAHVGFGWIQMLEVRKSVDISTRKLGWADICRFEEGFQDLVEGSARLSRDIEEPASKIDDEHSRFQLYVKNSGATRTGRSSLQYRLREASGIRIQVVSSLQILAEFLDDALVATIEMEDREDEIIGTNDIDELDDLVCDIGRIITSLLRLSVAIRNPAPHDRFSLSVAETDTSYFHPRDIAHVQDKFPVASSTLCERLGKANSYRRQYFKYREARHIRLEQGTSPEDDGRSTIASSIPQALKDGEGLARESEFVDEDQQSEGGQTQTTIAVENDRLPPLPALSRRGPFECSFCYTMIAVSTIKAWQRHILRDLRCYVCLHDDCPGVTQQFERRHDWIQHMRQQHWRLWHCPVGCEERSSTWKQLATHLALFHGQTVVSRSTTSRPRPWWIEEPCPLCNEPMRSAPEYQSHVGEHHIDLALFALPNAEYESLESQELLVASDSPGDSDESKGSTAIKSGDEGGVGGSNISENNRPEDQFQEFATQDSIPGAQNYIKSYRLKREKLEEYMISQFPGRSSEIKQANGVQDEDDYHLALTPKALTEEQLDDIEKLRMAKRH